MIKRIFFAIIFIPFILKAGEENLNKNYFTLKVEKINIPSYYYLGVTKGLYFGIEGAFKISKRTFFAIEIGYGNPKDKVIWKKEAELIFIPLELNLKHKFEINKRIDFNLGYGISESLARINSKYLLENEKSAGFQVFFDLNYNFKKSFIGISLKSQKMFDFGKTIEKRLGNSDYDNYRIGINFGYFLK